jgi:hypothetical protein
VLVVAPFAITNLLISKLACGEGAEKRHAGRVLPNRKSKIENKNGPDWARTSDPALIKRML